VDHIVLYDRSRVTTDWRCPRSRYWGYEYQGKGITSGNIHLELYMGTAIHDALGAIATFQKNVEAVNIDLIATTAKTQMVQALLAQMDGEDEYEATTFANEQAALVEGLVRGYYRHVWPRLLQQYPTIISIEQEMTYEHDNLTFMARPDLIMADTEGNLFYIEYKSTSSKREDWINSWNTAIQLHSSVRAAEATLGEPITAVVVQGLYKGYPAYGKQSSPFCYAYFKTGNPPFTEASYSYEYKAGYKRTPTWELDGGVKQWVEDMPDAVLADQFPQTPPIFINDDLLNAFFRQRAEREPEIAVVSKGLLDPDLKSVFRDQLLDMAFPQKFDQCVPGWGKPCQFRMLCHGVIDDPLKAGFEYRIPHHALELEEESHDTQ
jgi:hypothetical protein